jgi:integrase
MDFSKKMIAPHGDEHRASQRKRVVDAECLVVEEVLRNHFPQLIAGTCPSTVLDDLIDSVFDRACASVHGHLFRTRHNYLVGRLNKIAATHQLTLQNRQRMVVVRSDPAPATPLSFVLKAEYEMYEELFWANLSSPSGLTDLQRKRHDSGRLIYSMIWHGGVHSIIRLSQLLITIGNGVHCTPGNASDHALVWLEPSVENDHFRWFPDPTTLALLYRYYKEYGVTHVPESSTEAKKPDAQNNAGQLLRRYVETISPKSLLSSGSNTLLRQMMDAASAKETMTLAGIAQHIQGSAGLYSCLPRDTMIRLMTGLIPPAETASQAAQRAEDKRIPGLNPLRGETNSGGKRAVSAIRDALKIAATVKCASKKHKGYKALMEIAKSASWPPIVRVIALWCAQLRLELQASSILRYLSEFAEPLVAELSDIEDLNQLDGEDWEFHYSELLKATSSQGQRAYRASVLGRFHRYLATNYALPDAYIEGATGTMRVDSEILTVAEYYRVLKILKEEPNQRLSEARQLAIIFGFRCGLRRGEVLRILMGDLQGLHQPELQSPTLIVRGSRRYGPTKTTNGTRILPLWGLLTNEELSLLRRWYRRRVAEQSTLQRKGVFFCPLHQPDHLMGGVDLIDPIQSAMRQAAGTQSMRFHHCRHAFATFSTVRLLETYPGEFFSLRWAVDDEGRVVMPHWGKDWFAVLSQREGGLAASDKLYYLQLMVGHASPGQTIRTYSHLMDFVVRTMRWAIQKTPIPNRLQAELLGQKPDSVEPWRNRKGLRGPTSAAMLAAKLNRWPAGATVGKAFRVFKIEKQPLEIAPAEEAMPSSALLIYQALYRVNQLMEGGTGYDDALAATADLLGIPVGVLNQCYKRGEFLMRRRARRTSKRNAHTPGMAPVQGKIAHKVGVGGVIYPVLPQCPAPPKPRKVHRFVEELFSLLVQAAKNDAELFRKMIETVVLATQRSKIQLSFRPIESKCLYLQFLDTLELMPLVWVDVQAARTSPGNDQLLTYWSEQLSLPRAKIRVRSDTLAGDRSSMGVARVTLNPSFKKLGPGALQHTISSVRFVAFVAMISFNGRLGIDEDVGL